MQMIAQLHERGIDRPGRGSQAFASPMPLRVSRNQKNHFDPAAYPRKITERFVLPFVKAPLYDWLFPSLIFHD